MLGYGVCAPDSDGNVHTDRSLVHLVANPGYLNDWSSVAVNE